MDKDGLFLGKKKKVSLLIVAVAVTLLIVSTLSTAAFISRDTQESSQIILVDTRGAGTRDITLLNQMDVDIIDRYGDFVLVEVDVSTKSTLQSSDLNVNLLPQRTTISVKGHSFDITDGGPDLCSELTIEAYRPGTRGYHIVHMLGPINPLWLEQLETLGVELINYVPNYAYEARMTPEQAIEVEDLFFVDWVGIYQPAFKLQQDIEPGRVDIRVLGINDIGVFSTLQTLTSDIEILDLGGAGYRIIADVDDMETIRDIAFLDDVYYISQYSEPGLLSEIESQIIGGGIWIMDDQDSDPGTAYRKHGEYGAYINQLGYTGKGVVMAVPDTGLGDGTVGDAGHPDFTGRVIGGYTYTGSGWDDGHGHGTHIAGSMAGDTFNGTGVQYAGLDGEFYASQGLAYDSELYVLKIFNSQGGWEGPNDIYPILEIPKQEGDVYVHSNSWGDWGNPSHYLFEDEIFDRGVRDADRDEPGNQPIVAIAASGNEGRDGYGTTISPGTAKNTITIGGTQSYNPQASNYGSDRSATNPDRVADFSSRGWTADNRIKPDVVAPGQAVLSTHIPGGRGGGYSLDDRYGFMSGTSMATPAAGGAASVVVEWYETNHGSRPSPAMVKALMINTAYDLDDNNGNTGPIPNRDEGWGMVDISKLEYPMDDPVPIHVEDENSLLTTGETDEYLFERDRDGTPLKISLVWTDRNALTGDNPTLKNDLNLEVESPSGQIYRGNAFSGGWTQPDMDAMAVFDRTGDGWDDTNNVENVYIHQNSVESGLYTVRVTGFDIPADANNDGQPNQDYALVVYNGHVRVPPSIDLESPTAGDYWKIGDPEEITWSTEAGMAEISGIDIEYSTDGGISWSDIVSDYDDTGSYHWLIPDEPTSQAVVRVTVYDYHGISDSDTSGEFNLSPVWPPSVTLLSPVGGEQWNAGEERNIQWNSVENDASITGVDIELSKDGGSSWEYIVQDIPDSGSYLWGVPDVTSETSRIRVTVHCAQGTSGRDRSPGLFTLTGYPPEPPEDLSVERFGVGEALENGDFIDDHQPWSIDRIYSGGEARWDSEGYVEGGSIYSYAQRSGSSGTTYEKSYWEQDIIPISGDIQVSGAFRKVLERQDQYFDRMDEATVEVLLNDRETGWQSVLLDDDTSWGDTGWTEFPTVTYTSTGYVDAVRLHMHLEPRVGAAGDTSTGQLWMDAISVYSLSETEEHNLVSWSNSPDDPGEVEYYNVYRSESGSGPWDQSTYVTQVEADGSEYYNFIDVGKGDADDTIWWYQVRAQRWNGVESTYGDPVVEPGGDIQTMDITLSAESETDGWNFISFNLIPLDNTLETLLSDIEGSYTRVLYHEPSTQTWLSHLPGRASRYNNLGSWDHRMGIWIQMQSTEILTIEGLTPVITEITLYPGWNMIGLPSTMSGNHDIPEEVDKIGYFEASAEYNLFYDNNPGTFVFEPGKAYWIRNPTDTTVVWEVSYL